MGRLHLSGVAQRALCVPVSFARGLPPQVSFQHIRSLAIASIHNCLLQDDIKDISRNRYGRYIFVNRGRFRRAFDDWQTTTFIVKPSDACPFLRSATCIMTRAHRFVKMKS